MGTTARAAVFEAAGKPFRLTSFDRPRPRGDEILVDVVCSTICASDVHTYSGKRSTPLPTILGHEILGRVSEFGPRASRLDFAGGPLNVGDRVTWSVAASCGACFPCRSAIPQKCDVLFKYGHEAIRPDHRLSGGLAEACLLASGSVIVGVPDRIPDRVACPANCSTATVAAVLRAAGLRPGGSLVVIGAGILGLTAFAQARSAGADAVLCLDLDPRRAERARDFGATECFHNLSALESRVLSLDGKGADAAVELSGTAEGVETCLRVVRVGGSVVLAGTVLPTRSVALDPERVVRRLLTIRGVHNYAPIDLLDAIRFLDEHASDYPFAELVGESFPLSEVDAAFRRAADSPGVRIAVIP